MSIPSLPKGMTYFPRLLCNIGDTRCTDKGACSDLTCPLKLIRSNLRNVLAVIPPEVLYLDLILLMVSEQLWMSWALLARLIPGLIAILEDWILAGTLSYGGRGCCLFIPFILFPWTRKVPVFLETVVDGWWLECYVFKHWNKIKRKAWLVHCAELTYGKMIPILGLVITEAEN